MDVKNSIKNLKEKDIYSILLFAIYKMTNDPQYSTLSELIYTVDKNSLLNLCSIFGGCTIKIPTIQELKLFSNGLLVYDLVNSGKTFSQAFIETGLDLSCKKEIAMIYKQLEDILKDYGK